MGMFEDLAFPIEEKVKKEYEQEKALRHQQKINRINALSMTREICIGLFLKKLIKKSVMVLIKSLKTQEI